MGVGAIGGAANAAAPSRDRVEVPAQRTPVTRADLRGAIARAHQKLTGQAPSQRLLDTLTAHASLETGSGSQMYNYNFGGIKGAGPTGATARCRTKEVIDGREVEVRDGFRAYASLDEGALDYVRLMRGRFGGAIAFAEGGDVTGFAHALKQARYYTADETKYASALRRLSGVAGEPSAAPVAAAPVSPPRPTSAAVALDLPGSIELGRVLDAIARHPTTIADPDDDA